MTPPSTSQIQALIQRIREKRRVPKRALVGRMQVVLEVSRAARNGVYGALLTLDCGHVIWRRCHGLTVPKRTHCPEDHDV